MVAASENNVIGFKGDIPWHQQADLNYMKRTIAGCPLVMGRKTHELIGRPLPGHRNIVVTRQQITFPGCDTVSTVEEGIALAQKDTPREVFIYGGGEIYKAALPFTDRIYLTRVHAHIPEGDAFFPEVDWSEWNEVKRESFPADKENDHPYTFLVYERKR